MVLISETPEWKALAKHVEAVKKTWVLLVLQGPSKQRAGACGRSARQRPPAPPAARRHLKDLLQDDARTEAMIREFNGIYLDFSRQNATPETVKVRRQRWRGREGA